MTEEWFDRFKAAVQQDPRTPRQISLAAGLGVNYVQQALKDGKNISVANLLKILDVLGGASAFYILTGYDFGPDDDEMCRLVLGLDPALRRSALRFFHDLKDREEK